MLFGIAALLMMAAFANPVEAGPIAGSFSITGNFLAVDQEGNLVALDEATALDFIELSGSTPTPGEDGKFMVNSAKGDFSGLVGQVGLVTDFSFAGAGSASFPNTPLLAFQTVGNLMFDLTSVTIVRQTADVLFLSGAGVFKMNGFDDTSGTFKFSGNEADQTFSFSASERATGVSVPEPASSVLFGLGVVAILARSRRKPRLVQ
jgi:hypothetical protein